MSEGEATEATIGAIYKAYYAEMGGAGTPPDVRAPAAEPAADNVTAFRRPAPKQKAKLRARPLANPETAAPGGADLRLSRRGLCRDRLYWR